MVPGKVGPTVRHPAEFFLPGPAGDHNMHERLISEGFQSREFARLSIYLSTYLSIFHIYLSIYLFIYLPIYLPIYLSGPKQKRIWKNVSRTSCF